MRLFLRRESMATRASRPALLTVPPFISVVGADGRSCVRRAGVPAVQLDLDGPGGGAAPAVLVVSLVVVVAQALVGDDSPEGLRVREELLLRVEDDALRQRGQRPCRDDEGGLV